LNAEKTWRRQALFRCIAKEKSRTGQCATGKKTTRAVGPEEKTAGAAQSRPLKKGSLGAPEENGCDLSHESELALQKKAGCPEKDGG